MDACRITNAMRFVTSFISWSETDFALTFYKKKSKNLECSGSMDFFTLWTEAQPLTPNSTSELGSGLRCFYCAQKNFTWPEPPSRDSMRRGKKKTEKNKRSEFKFKSKTSQDVRIRDLSLVVFALRDALLESANRS